MLNKTLINLLFIVNIQVTIFSMDYKEQIEKIAETLKKRGCEVENGTIKKDIVYFTIKNLNGDILTAECKVISSIEFGCIYRQSKDFKSKLEFFARLKDLEHHNQLKIYDVFECAGFLCIIREHFEGAVVIMDSKLVNENKEMLLISLLKPIFNILDYFLYLRHKGLYHGDIISENILINENGVVKICGLFSINKSYVCKLPTVETLDFIQIYEEDVNEDYGKDMDIKHLFELIMNLVGANDIKDFIDENLKNFLEYFEDCINIKENNLCRLRNHKVFDDLFDYNILDFRVLSNFLRMKASFSIQKINTNKLMFTEKKNLDILKVIIEIKPIYNSVPFLMNKIHHEFLQISCFKNQETIILDKTLLKNLFNSISLNIFLFKDGEAHIYFGYELEITAIYIPKTDTIMYDYKDFEITVKKDIIKIKFRDELKIHHSISAEENNLFKMVLILSSIFRSIKYNCSKSKLECAKAYERFITFYKEIPSLDKDLQYKQYVYVLKLPYFFIDGIGSVEVDDGNYIYRLESELNHEIYEMNEVFYKIHPETKEMEVIELTEMQKSKIQYLKAKILVESHLILTFRNQFD